MIFRSQQIITITILIKGKGTKTKSHIPNGVNKTFKENVRAYKSFLFQKDET